MSEALQGAGGVEIGQVALLSEEGSTIETAVEIVRGVVPELYFLRMHSEVFRQGNHPSRHRKKRDDAALLTQEGNRFLSPSSSASIPLRLLRILRHTPAEDLMRLLSTSRRRLR